MDLLKCAVFADPSRPAAEHLVELCERLAAERLVTTTGEETLRTVLEHKPEMLVLSIELQRPDALEVAAKLIKSHNEMLVVATFREMSVPAMERLGRLGVQEFLPQPVDLTLLFRAASERFGLRLRRHDRYSVTVDVTRADGVLVGKTLDMSLGGLRMQAIHPLAPDDSLLLSLAFADGQEPLRVRCYVLAVEGAPPQQVVARMMFHNLRGPEYRRLANYLKTCDTSRQQP